LLYLGVKLRDPRADRPNTTWNREVWAEYPLRGLVESDLGDSVAERQQQKAGSSQCSGIQQSEPRPDREVGAAHVEGMISVAGHS
jgi:hypothetical protein